MGVRLPPLIIPDQTEAQRDEKKNLETAFPPPPHIRVWMTASPPPSYLKVWIRHCTYLILKDNRYKKHKFGLCFRTKSKSMWLKNSCNSCSSYKKHKFGLCFRTKSKSMWLKNSCNSCSSYKFVKQKV